MKKIILFLLTLLLLCGAASAATVIPGGGTIGLSLTVDGAAIVSFSRDEPKRAGLECGDVITAVDGRPVDGVTEVLAAVAASEGKPLRLTVRREGETKDVRLAPVQAETGWQLGLYLRDRLTGIGTVTYYEPDSGTFAALGHGVSEGGALLPLKEGTALESEVVSVVRGQDGAAGTLHGAVAGGCVRGEISENTPQGVFGTMDAPDGQAVQTGTAHIGEAVIRSNVHGSEVEEFTVRIRSVNARAAQKNLLIEVTDPALLEQTGGIVQGMSGSPILQDGKLVGAVTHVLLDDPATGYGILIDRMLCAA